MINMKSTDLTIILLAASKRWFEFPFHLFSFLHSISRAALYVVHFAGWKLIRLTSSDSRVLLIWFFLFQVDVFGPTERFRDRIVSVAVPTKEFFFTWGPGEVFVSSRAPRRMIDKGCLFLLACH